MTRLACDGPTLVRAVASAVANLERHVTEVDALNVFPVPDGDTGTNMLATMRAALAEVEALPPTERSLERVADALSRGALLGARGNSGVILSQIIRGMTAASGGQRRANGLHLSAALREAAETAWGAVGTPVEGTILTVIRDAADAAEAAASRQPHVETVLGEAVAAAARSVARTPDLLPVLRDAGVVDSGGQGLYHLLRGTLLMDAAVSEDLPEAGVRLPQLVDPGAYGYETMFLVRSEAADLDPAAMRDDLERLGDSVLVAGDERAIRVHVHGPRPDLVLGYGLSLGHLSGISVENLDDQARASRERPAARTASAAAAAPSARRGQAVVAVATGDGLARLFMDLGAATVLRPSEGTRPSTGELARTMLALDAPDVLVLTNDPDARLAAGQAADMVPGVGIHIVPTRDAAEGVAAMLAWRPDRSPVDNVAAMVGAAARTRSFRVTSAARDATVQGVSVRVGDALALGPDDGLLAAGPDPVETVLEALRRLGGTFELVTLYRGEAADEGTAEHLAGRVTATFPDVETELVEGGQRHDLFLVSVD